MRLADTKGLETTVHRSSKEVKDLVSFLSSEKSINGPNLQPLNESAYV